MVLYDAISKRALAMSESRTGRLRFISKRSRHYKKKTL